MGRRGACAAGRAARGIVNRGREWALVVGLVLFASLPGLAAAAPTDELRAAEQRLQQARSEAARAAGRLDALRTDAALAIERYNQASVRLGQVRQRLAQVQARFERVRTRMAERQGRAGDFARRLYQRGSAFELEALLSAASPREVQVRAVYLYSAAQAELSAVATLRNDRRVYAVRLDELNRAHGDVGAMERRLGAERAAVEGLLRSQAGEVARLEGVAATAEHDRDQAARIERERMARERADREVRERADREARERADREARRHEDRERAAQARQRAAQARQRAAQARQQAARLAASQYESDAGRAHHHAPVPGRTAGSAPPERTSSAHPGEAAVIAVEAAKSQIGKPYEWGAEGPDSYDCSGLTKWAWGQAGIYLPHSSRMQYSATQRINRGDVQPGDLLFFGSPIHHVGIYIGDNQMVNAPYTGSHVGIRPAWRDDLTGIGRPRD